MGFYNFGKYKIAEVSVKDSKEFIYDKVRKKDVPYTPEEKVRQQVLTYLTDVLDVPEYMIDEEIALKYYKVDSAKRPDILILKKDESSGDVIPMAVIECKRNNTVIDESILEQTLFYAVRLNCRYAMITDGSYMDVAYCDFDNDTVITIKEMPSYKEMLKNKYEEITE